MSTEELHYIGARFTQETGKPTSIPGDDSGLPPDMNSSILNYPAEIITDPAARWQALENAGALIAEVTARTTGSDYIQEKKRVRREIQKIHIGIKEEMERGEEFFGTCRLNPLYQAGQIISLAESVEGTHIPAIRPQVAPFEKNSQE